MDKNNLDRETVDRHEHVHVTEHGSHEHRQEVVENISAEKNMALSRVIQFIWLLTGILEAMIGLRFILKLIAANPNAPFAQLVYSFTDLFLWPFQGLTATPSANGMVLEISALIAMLVYALLTWIVAKLLWLLFASKPVRSVRTYERENEIR